MPGPGRASSRPPAPGGSGTIAARRDARLGPVPGPSSGSPAGQTALYTRWPKPMMRPPPSMHAPCVLGGPLRLPDLLGHAHDGLCRAAVPGALQRRNSRHHRRVAGPPASTPPPGPRTPTRLEPCSAWMMKIRVQQARFLRVRLRPVEHVEEVRRVPQVLGRGHNVLPLPHPVVGAHNRRGLGGEAQPLATRRLHAVVQSSRGPGRPGRRSPSLSTSIGCPAFTVSIERRRSPAAAPGCFAGSRPSPGVELRVGSSP